MGLYEELQQSNSKYNDKLISELIISNRKNSGEISRRTKKIIFFMMKRIILKGVSQYFNTNNKRGITTPYENEDIIIEIYFVLEKCMTSFTPELNKNFYLYFNSAVARRITRMCNYKSTFDPNYKKISLDKEYGNNKDGTRSTLKDYISNKSEENYGSLDMSDLDDLFFVGFNQTDKSIMISLYNKETLGQIEERFDLTREELKNRIKIIKKQLGDKYGIE